MFLTAWFILALVVIFIIASGAGRPRPHLITETPPFLEKEEKGEEEVVEVF